jgi:3-(3-hydroxy-phenyl)propionate hydroxylase
MIGFALNMGRALAPPNALAAFALVNGFRLLSLFPKARDYIAQMKFKPPPRFEHGFIVSDRAGKRRTLVGRLLPQPRVRAPDGRDVLLDELLGPGFALLLRSPRADAVMPSLQAAAWRDLGARIVVMPPEAGAPDPTLARFSDHVLLVRPDRYVAACFAVDEVREGGRKVAEMIAGTLAPSP